MDQDNDISYYRRREASARIMAEGCSDAMIKSIHRSMADEYAAKVKLATDRMRQNLRLV